MKSNVSARGKLATEYLDSDSDRATVDSSFPLLAARLPALHASRLSHARTHTHTHTHTRTNKCTCECVACVVVASCMDVLTSTKEAHRYRHSTRSAHVLHVSSGLSTRARARVGAWRTRGGTVCGAGYATSHGAFSHAAVALKPDKGGTIYHGMEAEYAACASRLRCCRCCCCRRRHRCETFN